MSYDSDQALLLATFAAEAVEWLDELCRLCDLLRDQASVDTTREVSRLLHSLKGTASTVGNTMCERLSHVMEDAFQPHRATGRVPQELLRSFVEIAVALRHSMGGQEIPAAEAERLSGLCGQVLARPEEPEASARGEEAGRAIESGTNIASTVRVDTRTLDRLMGFAGEFLVSHGRIRSRHDKLEGCLEALTTTERQLPAEARDALAPIMSRLEELVHGNRLEVHRFGYTVSDFNAVIKRARMMPLGHAAAEWRRTVAEAAQIAKRDVRLLVEVGEVEIDRQVFEVLQEPILHLLRNAVGHGIEDPPERRKNGKPERGNVLIKAVAQDALVEVEVSDDGRGLDAARLRARAEELGLWTVAEADSHSDVDATEVIFMAGFSTSVTVDRLSGRGIGLDVARQRVVQLGGSIRVADHPRLGGTTFVLHSPVTLVSTRGLLLRTARTAYVVPLAYVARTLRVERAAVRLANGAPFVDVGGTPLRLRWLSSVVREEQGNDAAKLFVVVLHDGGRSIGLVVDEISAEVEFVRQRLPWNIRRSPAIAGAFMLGDGTIALVLDGPQILTREARSNEASQVQRNTAPQPQRRRLLIVDNSITSRTLVTGILTAAGYDVEVANDGEAAWTLLCEQKFDAVVSDIEMAKLDGLGLTQRIRADEKLRLMPVVLVSSLGSPTEIALGAEAGADEYIVKSRFDQDKLLDAIARHLPKRQAKIHA
jgi:two-component system chemotaxis sensor kinase CheA